MFTCRSLVTYCLVLSAIVFVLLVQLSFIVFLSKSFVSYSYINQLCNFTSVCNYHVSCNPIVYLSICVLSVIVLFTCVTSICCPVSHCVVTPCRQILCQYKSVQNHFKSTESCPFVTPKINPIQHCLKHFLYH